jgi:DNA-binding NtrC family response regulator
MAPGDELTLDLLPEAVLSGNRPRGSRLMDADVETLTYALVQQGVATAAANEDSLHAKIVNRVERELLAQVLLSCDNVQIKAAARLGINRNTLHKKVKDYGLENGKDEN